MSNAGWLATRDKITAVIGEDWNAPRSRIYIGASKFQLEAALKKSEAARVIERTVNERVLAVLSGLLTKDIKLD